MSSASGNGGGHSSDEKFRHGETAIHLSVEISAPREVIWDAIATGPGLAGWQADRVEGEVVAGRALHLSWPGLGAAVVLDVQEVRPGERVVLVNGASRVTLALHDRRVELSHGGLDEHDDLEGLTASWRIALSVLAHHCQRHPQRSRQVHWWLGRTRCSAEAAHVFFTDAEALARWLTRRGAVGERGSQHRLELADGDVVSGRVLDNVAGRDVALTWEEDDASVICLRTLPSADADERMIALSWSRWSSEPAAEARLEALRLAHARLLDALDRKRWI